MDECQNSIIWASMPFLNNIELFVNFQKKLYSNDWIEVKSSCKQAVLNACTVLIWWPIEKNEF